ncbi:MAG TPA: host attachment protein [Pseudolabrys sp.]|nr:host attachment protein [Pseudolabrys sp.]
MSDFLIRHNEYVVVCDGAKALVLENAGDAKLLDLKTREVYEQKDLPTRELGTDAPGRPMNAAGGSMEQTDWHARAERAFLERLAARLDAAVAAGRIKSLILVAPPRALGLIRQACSPALRGAIRAEVDKDYVKLPVHEIERHLAA